MIRTTLQEMYLGLSRFWSERGCIVHQAYDLNVGAGTMHPETFFRSLGPDPWRVAYCQPSRRPVDGRYGENPMRVYEHFQYQVILKPSPGDVQDLYLASLHALGIDPHVHDIRFEEDNWESPTLGASGVGWQVTMDGMEISQFTYFQAMGGVELKVVPVELTYGLERICMFVNDIKNIFDIPWARADWAPGGSGFVPYRAIRERAEREQSVYSFEEADVEAHRRLFDHAESEAVRLLEREPALLLPGYERVLEASHLFNVLDARRALSVTERQGMIQRVRRLSVLCAKAWLAADAGILDRAGLAHGPARLFWTPRRLAVQVPATDLRTAEREETLLGPPAAAAWDAEGQPQKALAGFAAKQGLDPAAFTRQETPRGVYAAAAVRRGGEPVGAVLARDLPGAVAAMSFPKTMRWGGGEFRFVRPVHWVVALADGEVLPLELFGVKAGRATRGHRTLGHGPHDVPTAEAWEGVLEKAGVVADPTRRRDRLADSLREHAANEGGRPVDDPELLQESADIVEYPGALCGAFGESFVRDVPKEVLETCLRHHQKAFLVIDGNAGALPRFAVAVNVPRDPEGHVKRGHEWVVSGRLADAVYFWENDRKQRLDARLPALEGVVFQKELGTYADKTRRLARLAEAARGAIGLSAAETTELVRAATLARGDLVSGLVGEFPELQGVAGGLLARADGEPEGVAAAVYDLYRPAGVDDALPATRTGRLLGILDRLDTLAGGFAVGLAPSGSRDPFALRRAAQALVRLAAAEPAIDLRPGIMGALAIYDGTAGGGPDLRAKSAETTAALTEFLLERWGYLMEREGARYDEVNAVRALVAGGLGFRPGDLAERVAALRAFRGSADFTALAAAGKRCGNILAQARERGDDVRPGENADALALPAETGLAAAVAAAETSVATLVEGKQYRDALGTIAALRPAVDRFFEDVLVMDKDDRVRRGRLGLLARVRTLARAVVDMAEIVVEGSPT